MADPPFVRPMGDRVVGVSLRVRVAQEKGRADLTIGDSVEREAATRVFTPYLVHLRCCLLDEITSPAFSLAALPGSELHYLLIILPHHLYCSEFGPIKADCNFGKGRICVWLLDFFTNSGTMAEAIVAVLIDKLGEALLSEAAAYGASLLCTEACALKGLLGEIHRATGWLKIMKAFLQDSEKFRDTNKTTKAFVEMIRSLAFRMEDVVDEFKYKLEDAKHGRFASKMKKRIQHVKVWRRLAQDLRDINADLEVAAKQRDLCALPEGFGGGGDHHSALTNETASFAREEDLVGIKDNADKLKGWLLCGLEERKRKIVAVWGMGGAGKTTLINHVYKIVKEEFDYAAWVTVSKSYQVKYLLKKIAQELGISVDISNMEMRSLGELISNHLQNKSYILVLDDVWEQKIWIDIIDVFPYDCSSRFIFTSRNFEVAAMATSGCVINLERLQDNDSWRLFCKLAFRNVGDTKCPSELHNLAGKFLEKCDGLPFAIACIGRLLSCKSPTLSEWKKVYGELESQSTVIHGVDSILKVSFEDLSYELKNCFLHCALFPEDYDIKRRRLIRHWITSGFVKEKGNKTLEEVAEDYLYEIINRSLLQVTRTNEFRRVKSCRMHDIVRHLALKKAEEECFGKTYDGYGTFSEDGVRRLSFQSANIAPLCESRTKHLRAIHSFTSNLEIDLLKPIFAYSSLLSILDMQGTQIMVLPNEVFSLFNLRFLGLRETRIEILPDAVGRLQNLEVLDAAKTGLVSLPKSVVTLKKLRFLYACSEVTERGGVKVPTGIRNLTRLHALQQVKASFEILCDVAALTELRTFSVSGVASEHSSNLCRAVMNMSHLVHLSVFASSENEVLPFEELCLPRTLCKLDLTGQLERKRIPQIFSSWSHLGNLTNLFLKFSKLDDDSFSSLLVLHGLCDLRLAKAYDGKRLCFPAHSFPRLRYLLIFDAPQLNQVEIEEAALRSLAKLQFGKCQELKCLPRGIENLAALELMSFAETAEELMEKLRQKLDADECNEELMKISHIRKVVMLTEKNIWERIR
ncbi:hypothetical protein EJB05_28814, partial [Eragrostis curvula]